MDSRELVKRVLNREPVDRIPMYDSYWNEVVRDFHAQGVPENTRLEDHFQLDFDMFWFEQDFLLPKEVLEEQQEFRIETDGWGTTNKVFTETQSTPGLIDFAVKTRDEWEQSYKDKLAFRPGRIDRDSMLSRYETMRAAGKFIVLSMLDPFECSWHIVGPENQFMMLVTDPDWLKDMYDTHTTLIEDGWKALHDQGIRPDALWLYGDIAYNKGMLFAPDTYRSLLQPFHARLASLAHQDDAHLIYHTDGNPMAVLPDLIDAGVDCLQPMEVKAGMDVLELKRQYGDKLAFMGNIDARHYQNNDIDGLRQEIERKIPAAMEDGGYIYHSDHSIPPGTTLETYVFALNLVRELGRY
jgi:uroporphyrinogen decarboxylase